MKKINTSPISGMQELLPKNQLIFDLLKSKIAETYRKHGYLHIETPIIDRDEILFAKAGGDTEKQVYRIFKTAETANESDQALRFDHTVPLARYVVEHENDLTFPFKVTQIARNFRGERAQRGRFREFYQCDIDIIGRDNLPLSYDADVISTLLTTFDSFNLNTKVLARVSNRKILSGLIEAFNLEEKSKDIYGIIDHSEKVPFEKTKADFLEIGLSDDNTNMFLDFINISGSREEVISKLENLNIKNEKFNLGLEELNKVINLVELENQNYNIIADMKIVRGLDYYTGTVFEFILPEYKEIGSVCGGGRYENLANYFTDQILPGVGGSIGLTRLFYVLSEKNLINTSDVTSLDYALIPLSDNELDFTFRLAKKLRENYSVTTILTDKKLGDKLAYASKIAKFGIVIGEDETKTGVLKVKNFLTGEISDFQI